MADDQRTPHPGRPEDAQRPGTTPAGAGVAQQPWAAQPGPSGPQQQWAVQPGPGAPQPPWPAQPGAPHPQQHWAAQYPPSAQPPHQPGAQPYPQGAQPHPQGEPRRRNRAGLIAIIGAASAALVIGALVLTGTLSSRPATDPTTPPTTSGAAAPAASAPPATTAPATAAAPSPEPAPTPAPASEPRSYPLDASSNPERVSIMVSSIEWAITSAPQTGEYAVSKPFNGVSSCQRIAFGAPTSHTFVNPDYGRELPSSGIDVPRDDGEASEEFAVEQLGIYTDENKTVTELDPETIDLDGGKGTLELRVWLVDALESSAYFGIHVFNEGRQAIMLAYTCDAGDAMFSYSEFESLLDDALPSVVERR